MPRTHRLRGRAVWLVGRASLRAQRLIQDRLAAESLRKQHYGILASLADAGPAAQTALADRIALDRGDLVSRLDELERLGHVIRKADPADRRRNIIELTAKGKTVLAKLDVLIFAADDELLAPLTEAERKTLVTLLAKLVPND